MAPSAIFFAQALAIGATAVALAPRAATTTDPYCAAFQRTATNFPTQSSSVSSFCSSYFHPTTSTSTTTQTITNRAVATTTSTVTVTTTPTSTVTTGSQTCFQNTAVASPAMKKRATPQQSSAAAQASAAASSYASAQASSSYSRACSCAGFDFAPKTTQTAFTTTTQFVATSTAVVTSTSTAPAATTSVESTSYYTPSGTYVADDGDVYTEYNGFDFFGNDLYSGLCDGNPGNVNTPVGNFACNGFEGCENVCSQYNDANAAQGGAQQTCKGATYSISNQFCYLKSAVPGNGSANCQAMMNANTNSGIRDAQPGTN